MAEETFVSSEGAEGTDTILRWPETLIDQSASANCTCGNITIGRASRVCGIAFESKAMWETPDDSACVLNKTVGEICRLATLNNVSMSFF